MNIKQDPEVKKKFDTYPVHVKSKINYLRDLVIKTASETKHIKEIKESLKWGEPSYAVKKGSPIRIDWKAKTPLQYAMYFNCSTTLVDTFKMLYGGLFKYEKSRAIVFHLNENIPEEQLKDCIDMALNYQSLKDKPLLGR